MAAIRMSHPDHGFTHAYDSGEIEKLKLAGWKVEQKQEKVKDSPPAPLSQLEKNTRAALAEKGLAGDGLQQGNPSPGPIVNEQLTPAVTKAKPGPKPKAK